MKRPTFYEYYLNIADAVAKRSTCMKRNYGAVIVSSKNEIIATGYNGAPRGCESCLDKFEVCPRLSVPSNGGNYLNCASVHAEQNCIISAARKDMIGGTMFLCGRDYFTKDILDTTCCEVCKRLIINAGIEKVVIAHPTEGYKVEEVSEWIMQF